MKKLVMLISISIVLFSCNEEMSNLIEESSLEERKSINYKEISEEKKLRVKIKFKHDKCEKPKGICIIISIGKPSPEEPGPLFRAEDYWGDALLTLTDKKLKITPFRKAHNENNIVPVTSDILIDPEISKELGYSSIIILAGKYPIENETKNEWGVFYPDIIVK